MKKTLALLTSPLLILTCQANPAVNPEQLQRQFLAKPHSNRIIKGCIAIARKNTEIQITAGLLKTKQAQHSAFNTQVIKCEYGLKAFKKANCTALTSDDRCTKVNLSLLMPSKHVSSNNNNIYR